MNGVWVEGSFPRAEVDEELRRLRGASAGPNRSLRRPRIVRKAPEPRPATARTARRGLSGPASTGAIRPSPGGTDDDGARIERLRTALEQKARQIRAELASAGQPGRHEPADHHVEALLEPLSETIDYVGGTRTTTFTGGVVIREPLAKPRGSTLGAPVLPPGLKS